MAAKKHLTAKILLFLIFTDLLETFSQFCFKKGANAADFLGVSDPESAFVFFKTVIPSPFIWLGLISVSMIFIIWVAILSRVDLSVAVPVASFSYITIPLVSHIFLHEHISHTRWMGIFCILVGVILVSVSTRHREGAA